MATKGMETLDAASLQALLGPQLTAEQAVLIFRQGQEAVVFSLLTWPSNWPRSRPSPLAPIPRLLRGRPRLTRSRLPTGEPKPKAPSQDILDIAALADADRPSGGTPIVGMSQVPRTGSTLPILADPGHRGHPRRHHTGGDRTYDSSLLVPPVQEHRRAGHARRFAWLDNRPAGRRALGLAALSAGHHAGADHRRVQLPPPVQAVFRWPGTDVAPAAGNPLGLVPGNPGPSPRQRRAPRRRDRLAGQRQDILVVVFRVEGCHLLHDRSPARQSGLEEVLQKRVRWSVGDRLLGRLQRGRLRRSRNACRICCAT